MTLTTCRFDYIINHLNRKGIKKMKAVITVTGRDSVGIIARVAQECAADGVNIIDISQSVLREYFAMIMLVDISKLDKSFAELVDRMNALGDSMGLKINTMHEEIFNTMHTV